MRVEKKYKKADSSAPSGMMRPKGDNEEQRFGFPGMVTPRNHNEADDLPVLDETGGGRRTERSGRNA